MRRERIPGMRLGFYFVCSLALHAALVALVSLRSYSGNPPSIARQSEAVNFELTAPLPPRRQTRTLRPGGGVLTTRADSSPHASHHLAHPAPAPSAATVDPEPDPAPPPPPAEAPPDEAVPVATRV